MKKKEKNPAAVALGRLGGTAKTTKPKGFAALSPERLRELSARGGTKKAKNRAKVKKAPATGAAPARIEAEK